MQNIISRHLYRTRLFLFTLMVVVLGAGLAGAGVFLFLPSGLGEGYGAVISTVQGIGSVLMKKVVLLYIVIALGIVLAMIVLHLFYSHRVAGPAFRIGKEASKISEGNLSGNIRFRQKDNLTDMADTLNDVATRYRSRVDALKDQLSVIEAESAAIATLLQQGKPGADLERAADEIAARVKRIDAILYETRTA